MSGQSKKCEVFIVSDIVKHPNADTLSIIRFYNYECVVKTDSFKPGDKAVYIPPDSIVPLEKPEFSFLAKMKKTGRIKSQKLRGVQSTGLVIPAPKGYNVGDDVSEYYGITHYSAPEIETVGEVREQSFLRRMRKLAVSPFYKNYGKVKIPKYQGPYYDIESWFRYDSLFTEGEPVIVTEKIQGLVE